MGSKKVMLLFLLLPILLIDWSSVSHSKVILENYVTLKIDGFETPGEWVIKFSKYRTKNWEGDIAKPFEDAQVWLKWLSSDNFKQEELLPDQIRKNFALKDEKTILAIKGRWDFPGYNWLTIEPNAVRPAKEGLQDWLKLVADDKNYRPRRSEWKEGVHPSFIWLSGRTKQLYLYVWGGGFNYDITAHVQDYKGNDYILQGANLAFKGWRKIKFNVPETIRQTSPHIPNTQPIKFLRFKISANPAMETSSEFYMYVDYFHSLTDIYEPSYFGEELQFVENYWGQGDKSTSTPPVR